ncbi:hypothetical protein [Nocardiopsis sp. NPDC058789]
MKSFIAALITAYSDKYFCSNCSYKFRSQEALDAHVCHTYYP